MGPGGPTQPPRQLFRQPLKRSPHRGIFHDGLFLATCGDDCTVRLWDSEGSQVGEPVAGLGGAVSTAIFSPDSSVLVLLGRGFSGIKIFSC
ncbi:hypothetical protein ACFU96_21470 [Streptomyces sp. NPDC057620]|uniref:hypothetical protein n=1 Tax=Streptomyces sp. NPDC057620 TaxID=3346185 RepID=UPI0036CAE877